MIGRVEILGIPLAAATEDEALRSIAGWAEAGTCHLVFTPNPEMAVEAKRNLGFLDALRGADINLPDGTGLIFAALLRGQRLHRMPGVDMAERVVALAADRGWRVYLLGGRAGVADAAAAALRKKFLSLDAAAATVDANVDAAGECEQTDAVIDEISSYRPAVLLAAFGAPKQELWLSANRHALSEAGVGVAMGVGGTFDYWAGAVRRAPRWMSKLGIEWLWRLALQPQRFGRILRATVRFAALALAERLRKR